MCIGCSKPGRDLVPALLFFSFLLIAAASRGGGVKDARTEAMGGAGVALEGFWAVLGNQAGLAGERAITIGMSVVNRFMLRETTRAVLAFAIPAGDQVFAASYRQTGHALYREVNAGLAYARRFGERVDAGLQLDYRSLSLSGEYGRHAGVSFQLGIRIVVTGALTLAVHTDNPLALPFRRNDGEGPEGHWSTGLAYEPGDRVRMTLEVTKEFLLKPVMRGALEYELDRFAIVRAGFSTMPPESGGSGFSTASVITLGYGLAASNLRIDLGTSIHNMAGLSPAVSLQYVIGAAKKG